MAASGAAEDGFKKEYGGNGDVGAAVTPIEMLAMSDLSLLVKAGVQWGLFGGAIQHLGTERHHEAYLPDDHRPRAARLLRDDRDRPRLRRAGAGDHRDLRPGDAGVRHRHPHPHRRARTTSATPPKRPGGSGLRPADHARRRGPRRARLVVPIRDDEGNDLPGVTTSDCHYKGGLNGVDNGRIWFDHVRVPRENLLNQYADVAEDGTYSSPIENPDRRFFTMLGTLVRGRVSVGGARAPRRRWRWTSRSDTRWSAASSRHPATTTRC